jgi:hypothetical protein
MIFKKNDFIIIKENFLKNIKFGLKIYFNMEKIFNGRIDILNLKIEDTT